MDDQKITNGTQLVAVANIEQLSAGSIPKLNGMNFLPWRRQVTIILKLKGLGGAVLGQVDEITDMQATMILLSSMDDAHRIQVQAENTAWDIMKSLERQYQDTSAANKHRLISTFFTMKKSNSDSINQHIGKLKEIRASLINMKEPISDDLFQVIIINSLPESYGDVMKEWEMVHPDLKTIEFLIKTLQTREKNAIVNESHLMLMRNKNFERPQLSIAERMKKFPCKNCNKLGHWARDCPDKKDMKQHDNKRSLAPMVLNIGDISLNLKDKWLADSGASSHMSNDLNMFEEIIMYEKKRYATVGDGKTIEVEGKGKIKIIACIDGEWAERILTEVSYIPKLATNLISVGAFAKKGVETTFNDKNCTMILGDIIVATGTKIKEELYEMNVKGVKSTNDTIFLTELSHQDWHDAFGHLSSGKIKQTLRANGIEANGDINCTVCPAGKGTHSRHPTSTRNRSTTPGETMHVDIGYITNKQNEYNYYLICKDDCSNFCFIYFLKNKMETAQVIQKLIIDVEIGSGNRVKTIISDNGSEFINKNVNLLCLKENIKQEHSSPYIHQQNGRAEREIRSIKNMARCMIIKSGLGGEVIHEPLRTSCYLKNRIVDDKTMISPFEKFIGRPPNLNNIKKFGQPIQILKNGHYLTAFEPKTMDGYILGYTKRQNTYRVMTREDKRIFESCDIFFAPHLEENQNKTGDLNDYIQVEMCPKIYKKMLNDDIMSDKRAHKDPTSSKIDNSEGSISPNNMVEEEDDHDMLTSDPEHKNNNSNTARIGNMNLLGDENGGGDLDETIIYSTNSVERNDADDTLIYNSDCRPGRVSENTIIDGTNYNDTSEQGPSDINETFASAADTIDPICLNLRTPESYREAVSGSCKEQWSEAIKSELAAHRENETWTVVDRPNESKLLSARWIFTLKRKADGTIDRYKARLVARGYEQRYGIDYSETFAPVARIETVRTLLAIAAAKNLNIQQFDVSTAFLNGLIDEELYVDAPDGVVISPSHCLKLKKSLYGLKQAPRAWNMRLKETLKQLNFEPLLTDQCVFSNLDKTQIILIYVDDGMVLSECEEKGLETIDRLKQHFKIKNLDGTSFLGLEIKRGDNFIEISQEGYVNEMLTRFGINDMRIVSSPMVDNEQLIRDEQKQATNKPYREALGCLLYLANSTRPDILYAVNRLARYNQKPTDGHWDAVIRVFKYIKGTKDYAIRYEGSLEVSAYCDADHGGDLKDRKSTTGLIVKMTNGPIIFSSRKQNTVADSSTEAEYIAAAEAGKEISWLTQLLKELNITTSPPTLYIDNQSTITQIKNCDTKRRSKHIEIKYHSIREKYFDRLFDLKYISTEEQPADLLTKPLGGYKLSELTNKTKMLTRKSRKTGLMAHIAMFLILTLAIGNIAEGFFKQASTVNLINTDTIVFIGLVKQEVNYLPTSPCQIGREYAPSANLTRLAYETLLSKCRDYYERTVNQSMNEFKHCLKDKNNVKSNNRRSKRFDPITIMVVTTITIVVSSIITWAYTDLSPGSSYNRLNDLEPKVDLISERTEEITQTLEAMNNNLKGNQQLRNDTLSTIENLNDRIETNRQATIELASLSSSIAWDSHFFIKKMDETSNFFESMTTSCKRKKVDPIGFANVFKIKRLKNIKEEHTHLEAINDLPNDAMIIDFYYHLESTDTKISEIVTFPHFVDIETAPKLLKYAGPEYVVHNSTANCTRGIDTPRRDFSYEGCHLTNFTDPELQNWIEVKTDSAEFIKLTSPKVIKTSRENLIYCLYHDIEIYNQTFPCPHYPFRISIDEPFKLHNIVYQVTEAYTRTINRIQPINTPSVIAHGTSEDYRREAKAIKTIKENNDKSIPAGGFFISKGTITVPTDGRGCLVLLSSASLLIMIGGLLFKIYLNTNGQAGQTNISIDNNLEKSSNVGSIQNQIEEPKPILPLTSMNQCLDMKDQSKIVPPNIRFIPLPTNLFTRINQVSS